MTDFRPVNTAAAKDVFETYLRTLERENYRGKVEIRYGNMYSVTAPIGKAVSCDDYLEIGDMMIPWVCMVSIKKVK